MRVMIEVWYFLRSWWHGRGVVRFASVLPWRLERAPVAGWRSIKPAVPESKR